MTPSLWARGQWARGQWGLFLVAVQALTRLPVPAPYKPDALRRAVRYFPLVGIGVGLVAMGVFALARAGLPGLAAAGLSLGATLLLTGALHEDGLADCADGLFGGRTREDALRIMRDSRIGAFGALALVVVMGVKRAAVGALSGAGWALVAGHAAGRFWAVVPAAVLPYARADGMAGGVGAPAVLDVAIAGGFGLGALLLLGDRAFAAVIVSGLVAGLVVWSARRRLGGYTGDVLGATQVLTEVAVLLTVAWHPQ